jgi:hypothetical protein
VVQVPSSRCCVYYQGIGVDGRTGHAFVTYYSNSGAPGIWAEQVTPSGAPDGRPLRAPNSKLGLASEQTVTATGLGQGRPGVYTSYLAPHGREWSVDLYRIGARTALTVATFPITNTFGISTLAADPRGLLWVAWASTQSVDTLYVTRSNAAISKFARPERIALPRGTSQIWHVYLAAQANTLDVVAELQVNGKTAYWTTQVQPPK